MSFHGFPYPVRSVIVRLHTGDLWVWSPIALTPALRRDVDGLGPVRHLVSPNKLHHLFLQDWASAYPEARLWGPESTVEKRPDLHFAGALRDAVPAEWRPDLDQIWFRGSFALDEIVFCHVPSGTVIIADLVQTFGADFLRRHWGRWRFIARLGGITSRQAMAPLDLRLSFVNRVPARAARDRMLRWDCRRIVVAHGELPDEACAASGLARSFAWLGRARGPEPRT